MVVIAVLLLVMEFFHSGIDAFFFSASAPKFQYWSAYSIQRTQWNCFGNVNNEKKNKALMQKNYKFLVLISFFSWSFLFLFFSDPKLHLFLHIVQLPFHSFVLIVTELPSLSSSSSSSQLNRLQPCTIQNTIRNKQAVISEIYHYSSLICHNVTISSNADYSLFFFYSISG